MRSKHVQRHQHAMTHAHTRTHNVNRTPVHLPTCCCRARPHRLLLQYTNNWDGSEYKGSQFNILTLLAVLFVLTPVAGLAFAKLTYGTLWG